MARCLLSCNTPKHGPDGHAETRYITLAKDIARHVFAGQKDVLSLAAIRHSQACPFIYFATQIGKGDTRTQRVAVVRRFIDTLGPVGLLWGSPLRTTVVEYAMVKCAGLYGSVELFHRFEQGIGRQLQLLGQLLQGVGLLRREN